MLTLLHKEKNIYIYFIKLNKENKFSSPPRKKIIMLNLQKVVPPDEDRNKESRLKKILKYIKKKVY